MNFNILKKLNFMTALAVNLKRIVRHKYNLKQGDKIFVYNDGHCWQTEVEGFYCYAMKVKNGLIPFYARSFYSCGYNNDDRYIIVSKKWHYRIAKLIDDIKQFWYRLNII